MPDSSLVYVRDERTFVFTQQNSTDELSSLTLPSSIDDGEINRLAVSPDGRFIAFTLYHDGTLVSEYASFWMLDLTTNQIRQIAVSDQTDTLADAFHNFAWSPDGANLLVLEGGVGGASSSNPGVNANLYHLPSDTTDVLVVSEDDSQRSDQVRLIYRYLHLDRALQITQ